MGYSKDLRAELLSGNGLRPDLLKGRNLRPATIWLLQKMNDQLAKMAMLASEETGHHVLDVVEATAVKYVAPLVALGLISPDGAPTKTLQSLVKANDFIDSQADAGREATAYPAGYYFHLLNDPRFADVLRFASHLLDLEGEAGGAQPVVG